MADFCTLEEHHEYLDDIVKLKLWFVWNWLRRHPEEPFFDTIQQRVDIYRKTHLNTEGICPAVQFDDPRWIEMVHKAREVYESHKSDANASGFESDAFAVFQKSIATRASLSYRMLELRNDLKSFQCGCLGYNAPETNAPDRVFVHIANPLRPQSIFDDPDYIAACLYQLMDRCEKEFKIDTITTGTWLNSLPQWVAFFPPSWQDNMCGEEKEVQWHYGFWGQFINSRYTLNRKYAARLRQTGELPFYPRGPIAPSRSFADTLTG